MSEGGVAGDAGGVGLQEGLGATVGIIAFTLSEMGSHGRVSTYIVTGSLRLLSGEVCRGQRQ